MQNRVEIFLFEYPFKKAVLEEELPGLSEYRRIVSAGKLNSISDFLFISDLLWKKLMNL